MIIVGILKNLDGSLVELSKCYWQEGKCNDDHKLIGYTPGGKFNQFCCLSCKCVVVHNNEFLTYDKDKYIFEEVSSIDDEDYNPGFDSADEFMGSGCGSYRCK